jgi:hypothetical protein
MSYSTEMNFAVIIFHCRSKFHVICVLLTVQSYLTVDLKVIFDSDCTADWLDTKIASVYINDCLLNIVAK